ncbi:hypothetical protein [Puia dinghuensis]|uniref:Uncharacterized protein n=1 Tax=Puia dinghuensis TaxID=1792502 RepID=A0A8J2UIM1_9BACT|nr:hypothetical protein [Puia dinghuensis]GGB22722.1 hypothetical protein GCM10011511_53330 [Puia dinghuensis]
MVNPGNTFTDYLLLGITFLPLLPALLIFVRKLYGQEPLNFLVVICLLCFLRGIIGLAYPLTQVNQFIINKIFTLLLFLFFVLAFRSNLNGKIRYGLSLLLTALLSILFTYWSLKGWDGSSQATEILLNSFLAVLIGISLHAILHNDELGVFHSPLFWMEGGTLFYILLSLMLEGVGNSGHPEVVPSDAEKRLFLGLADLVRYLAYIAAVYAL